MVRRRDNDCFLWRLIYGGKIPGRKAIDEWPSKESVQQKRTLILIKMFAEKKNIKCLPKKTESQRKLSSKKVMKQIREKENRWNRWMLPESEQ